MENRQKIKQIQGERLKKWIDHIGITQKTLSELINVTPQRVNQIIKGVRKMSDENVRLISERTHDNYGQKVRGAWLLALDDYMTEADMLSETLQEKKEEATLLQQGVFSFAKLSGFMISINPIGNVETIQKDMTDYCTFSRDNKSVTLSVDELNAFENEICDYIELRLRYMTN